jgi:indole-3-glycerol phosphate synthase / phosphoribosylanthranilate isomerase
MQNILAEIVAHKRLEIEAMKASIPLDELRQKAIPIHSGFVQALQKDGINLIAEVKPKSPSGGLARAGIDFREVVKLYSQYATAISVLTDKKYFDGSYELLKEISAQTNLPLLCKDFVMDDYQCYLARSMQAQAVLLIVKILPDELLLHLSKLIASLGMTPVVEIQNGEEAKRAVAAGAYCIMINNRDLETFNVDLNTTVRLAPLLPPGTLVISASGISEREQIDYLSSACRNFLVGTSLMKAENIAEKLATLKESTKAH